MQADLVIEHRIITGITLDAQADGDCTVIDAAGKMVLPGMIDTHSHVTDPGPYNYREDWRCASRSAAAGGITTIADMPLPSIAVLNKDRVAEKLQVVENSSVVDFALWAALPRWDGPLFLLMFPLSRTLSALAVVAFPLAKDAGLAHAFATAADRGRLKFLLTVLVVLLGGGLCLRGLDGGTAVLAALGVFACYHRMAKKQFGGLSGDLAGWFLQTAELWMLGAVCLAQYWEAF